MEVNHEGGVKRETDGKLGDAQVGSESLEQLFHSLAAEGVVVEQHSLDGAPALLNRLRQLGRRLLFAAARQCQRQCTGQRPQRSAQVVVGTLSPSWLHDRSRWVGPALVRRRAHASFTQSSSPPAPPWPLPPPTWQRGGGENEERTFVGQLAGELDLLELGLDSGGLAQPRYPSLHVHLPLFLIKLIYFNH